MYLVIQQPQNKHKCNQTVVNNYNTNTNVQQFPQTVRHGVLSSEEKGNAPSWMGGTQLRAESGLGQHAAAALDEWPAPSSFRVGSPWAGWVASWESVGGTQQRCVELGRSVDPSLNFDPPTAARGTTPTTSKRFSSSYTMRLEPLLNHKLSCPGAASYQDCKEFKSAVPCRARRCAVSGPDAVLCRA